jgi:uncharacterized protein (DUF2147 family)
VSRSNAPGRGGSLAWALVVALSLLLASVLLAATRAAPSAVPMAPLGKWLTEDHDGVIEIVPCGGASLCGRIVGMTGSRADGTLPTDVHGRPQCGLTIISDAKLGPGGKWTGQITDPETGRIYNAQLWLDEAGRLHLHGFIGLPLFGATQVWTPYRAPVPKDCRLG